MAEVFRASYSPTEGFEKPLVLKRILPHLSTNERFIKMFRDEARITVHLTHNNIVQVFDFGEVDGVYFLAMEYVRGVNLRQLQKYLAAQNRLLPIAVVCYVSHEISKGLAYAHSVVDSNGRPLHIVHRDLNPPNVLLSAQGDVKITDFGIARAAHRLEETEAGRVKGKIAYMAPEVLQAHAPDYRADLWALGCVIHELLTGSPPYGRERDFEVPTAMVPIILDRPVPPVERDDVPDALLRARDVLLSKDPDQRPLSADEVGILIGSTVDSGSRRILQQLVQEVMGAQPREVIASSAPSLVATEAHSDADSADSGWNQSTASRHRALDDAISDSLEAQASDKRKRKRKAKPKRPQPEKPPATLRARDTRSGSASLQVPGRGNNRTPWIIALSVFGGIVLVLAVWRIFFHDGDTQTTDATSPVMSPATSPSPVASASPAAESPTPTRVVAAKTVSLTVTSTPSGADVLVNNKPVGKTPTFFEAKVGTLVHVQVVAEGRKPFIDIVSVPEDTDGFTIQADLPPLRYGTLVLLVSEPAHAVINGSDKGMKNRHVVRLVEATHDVVLENLAKGERCELKIEVRPDTTTTYRVDLQTCRMDGL